MKENLFQKLLVVAAYIFMVCVNALAETLPLNDMTIEQISNKYDTLITPVAATFSIWGLIYLFLAFFCVYQFNSVRGGSSLVPENKLKSINTIFILSSIFNAAWIVAWHYEYILVSLLIMVALFISLLQINRILAKLDFSSKDRWFVRTPFSIYFGWITIALVANISNYLVSVKWDGFGISDQEWTVFVLIAVAIIALMIMRDLNDWVYGLVPIWALVGMLIRHLASDGWKMAYPGVIATLVILIPIVVVEVLHTARKNNVFI